STVPAPGPVENFITDTSSSNSSVHTPAQPPIQPPDSIKSDPVIPLAAEPLVPSRRSSRLTKQPNYLEDYYVGTGLPSRSTKYLTLALVRS
ncbi:unnamed protein product, partial [Ilex paraguariensis]